MKQELQTTVNITQDERGQDWGWRKSCEMHRKKTAEVDRKEKARLRREERRKFFCE